MISRFKNTIKNIINKLFNEGHNPLEAIGISVNDISERIADMKPGDKREIEGIKYDIDFALEFSDVISIEEKQGLEQLKQLKQQLINRTFYNTNKDMIDNKWNKQSEVILTNQ